MIQIKRSKDNQYELSDKKQTVLLSGTEIILGDESIVSPGEYEKSGIEVVYANQAALLVWEKIQIVYIFDSEKPGAFEKNQFASADVLIISEKLEDISKNIISQFSDVYDPRMIIFGAASKIDASYKESIKPVEQTVIKIAAQTLPVEGRDYNILQ